TPQLGQSETVMKILRTPDHHSSYRTDAGRSAAWPAREIVSAGRQQSDSFRRITLQPAAAGRPDPPASRTAPRTGTGDADGLARDDGEAGGKAEAGDRDHARGVDGAGQIE